MLRPLSPICPFIYPMRGRLMDTTEPTAPANEWWLQYNWNHGTTVVCQGDGTIFNRKGEKINDWVALRSLRFECPVPLHGELVLENTGCTGFAIALYKADLKFHIYVHDVMIPNMVFEDRFLFLRSLRLPKPFKVGGLSLVQGWQNVNNIYEQARHANSSGLILKRRGSLYYGSNESSVHSTNWQYMAAPFLRRLTRTFLPPQSQAAIAECPIPLRS